MPMMPGAPVDRPGSEFDNFLFAPIAEESNGMLLRVVSVLARMDVDPWEEASRLARLPGETATRRLAALIAALPEGPSARQDAGTIAARLVGLLPHQARSAAALNILQQVQPMTRSRAVASVILYALLMLFLLSAQWLTSSWDTTHKTAGPSASTSAAAPR
jgi:hypothetical protein